MKYKSIIKNVSHFVIIFFFFVDDYFGQINNIYFITVLGKHLSRVGNFFNFRIFTE